MTEGEETFSIEEMKMGVKIFNALRWIMVLVGFVAIWFIVKAGANGSAIYLWIPVWAVVWLLIRFTKQYFGNIADSLQDDLAELGDTDQNELDSDNQVKASSKETNVTFETALVVYAVMIVVAFFWYGIGWLGAKIF